MSWVLSRGQAPWPKVSVGDPAGLTVATKSPLPHIHVLSLNPDTRLPFLVQFYTFGDCLVKTILDYFTPSRPCGAPKNRRFVRTVRYRQSGFLMTGLQLTSFHQPVGDLFLAAIWEGLLDYSTCTDLPDRSLPISAANAL